MQDGAKCFSLILSHITYIECGAMTRLQPSSTIRNNQGYETRMEMGDEQHLRVQPMVDGAC